MSLWILDTDHVSLLLNRHPQVSDRVAEVGADVAITIVTVQEFFNGWVVRINPDLETGVLPKHPAIAPKFPKNSGFWEVSDRGI